MKTNTFHSGKLGRRFGKALISFALAILLATGLMPLSGIQAFAAEKASQESQESQSTKTNKDRASDKSSVEKKSDSTDGSKTDDKESTEKSAENKSDVKNVESKSEKSAESKLSINSEIALRAVNDLPGIFTISSALNKKMLLDIVGDSQKNKAKLQLSTANHNPAQRFRFMKNSDGTYKILNVNSGKFLEVGGGVVKDGAAVWQNSRRSAKSQKWYVEKSTDDSNQYRISSALNREYCLDVPNGSAKKGAILQVCKSNDSKGQRFVFSNIKRIIKNGTYVVGSALGDKVLDLAGYSPKNGANYDLWEANNGLNQRFTVTYDTQTGYYRFTNVHSGKPMEVAGGSNKNGANVQSYARNNSNAQKWTIVSAGAGKYRIISAVSGLMLNVDNASDTNGANIEVAKRNNSNSQIWIFSSSLLINEGIFHLNTMSGNNLDVSNNSTDEGTQIQIYKPNTSPAQKFKVTHTKNGLYSIECLNSGLVVAQNESNNNVILVNFTNSGYQLWRPIIAGNGRFFFKNKATGLVLDVVGDEKHSGANVEADKKNNASSQRWTLVKTDVISEGLYVVPAAAAPNMVLDIGYASTEDRAGLQLYDKNNSMAQTFRFTKVNGGYYRITNLNSAKALEVVDGYINSASGQGRVQQFSVGADNKTSQLWRVVYIGKGQFKMYSACGDGKSCLDISNAAFQNETIIQVYRENNSLAQNFLLLPFGNIAYENVSMTVDNMVSWQKEGNPYIDSVSTQHLRDVIDPSVSMSNYYYAEHGVTYTSGVYQFADLRSTSGLTAAQLNSIISNNTLGKSGKLRGMGAAFITAANTYNLNESYLLAHAVLESGWGTSNLAKGNYYDGKTPINGRKYPKGTYYNFYGIGAYDSSPFSGGMSLAIQNGWNSPRKAIVGAAKWIANYYIYSSSYSQPTLYAMKWDYKRSSDNSTYGWHQYATDHLWARKIAKIMGEFYNGVGYSPSLYYIIPQYK